MPRPTAGAMVCGWMTLAPKYASSIASLYDSESMTWASGTRRGSADSTPSTSVQIWISARIQQRAEDRGGEIAAVAPERGLHAARIAGDEAGDDEAGRCRRWRAHAARRAALQLRVRSLPVHGRTERPPLHDDAAARIDPLHTAARAARADSGGTAGSTRSRRSRRPGRARVCAAERITLVVCSTPARSRRSRSSSARYSAAARLVQQAPAMTACRSRSAARRCPPA